MSSRFDVFVSYSHRDADWVRVLAGRLHQAGFEVFLDEWELTAGDVLVHSLEAGIRESASGVLVFSPDAVESPWVMREYAALMQDSIHGRRRLVPVMYRDTALPEFAATLLHVDFRNAEGPAFEAKMAELQRALKGQPPGQRPARDGLPLPAPGEVRLAGPRRGRLVVTQDGVEVLDLDRDQSVHASHGHDGGRLAGLLRDLHAARLGSGTTTVHRGGAGPRVQTVLREVGAVLGEVFAADPAGAALRDLVADAHGQGASLQLAVRADDSVADLPWEALTVDEMQGPLGLAGPVQMFRQVQVAGAVPAVQIRGPLRILVVLASPEGDDGAPLLDVEHELASIMDAVEPARKEARAYVRVLNAGTLAAIQDALTADRFHVLHICSHANANVLLLEDEQGRPDRITAADLVDALPADRRPPLVVLAGCSTAMSAQVSVDGSAKVLPGLARELLAAGAPQVVAMTASVTDRYASLFGGRFYRHLALADKPSVLAAIGSARRQLEAERRQAPTGSPAAELVEWATPALFVRGDPLPLYDPAAGLDELTAPAAPVLAAGIPLRGVGDFVGRRAELRVLGAALRRPAHPGVLLHGIGGVGKSSLAAELLRALGGDAGLVVSLVGAATTDEILNAFGQSLFAAALRAGLPDSHPDRQLAGYLRNPAHTWQQRLDAGLAVLAERQVTLLLDNFETNLDPLADAAALPDQALAEFLAAWIRTPGPHRLLITSRYPFALPGDAGRRLLTHHLGPLSLAETRKLIWRLPGLDGLTADQQHQAWTDVGGHPRTLEYLDALLRKGQARFADVTERLEHLLAENGVPDPAQWIADLETDAKDDGRLFGRALAEAITLTVNDTLLAELIAILDEDSRRLLIGAAVYRRPADEIALAWHISPAKPLPPDLLRDDLRQIARPPLADPTVAPDLLAGLHALGLVTPVPEQETGGRRQTVHRWTAAALARLHPERTGEAHTLAAEYFTWRFREKPQDRHADLGDQIEARYHHHAAGDLDAAIGLSYTVWQQLYTWSAWDRVRSVCQETLAWLPAGSAHTAAFTQFLGIIAQNRGDYPEAERRYRTALTINQELGDRVGAANSHGQLGILAYLTGDYPEAERRYQQALTINEELGNRAGAASTHHQLGMIAQNRGDYPEAERRYQQALTIFEELGDRAGAANSHGQLGVLAYLTDDDSEADRRVQQALTIFEELGDRTGAANSYCQLGVLAQDHGDHREAERRFHQALTIFEELGNRAGAANSYGQLGFLARARGDHPEAERRYQQAITIFEELGDRAQTAACYHELGKIYTVTGRSGQAVPLYCMALGIRVELRIPEYLSDLSDLAALRASVGDDTFNDAAATVLIQESVDQLNRMLDGSNT